MANGSLLVAPPTRELGSASPLVQRVGNNLVRAALVSAGLLVVLSYVLLAAVHLGDRFQINFCSSIYMSLAAELNHGCFYPELFDGARYGGTRYMPLEFVLHAGLARLTGEYLISGKILTYTLTLLLCTQLWFILRTVQCPRSAAGACVGLLFLTDCGYLACTTIRGDLLPVVCQLGALVLIQQAPTRPRVLLAACCCTLAVLAKFSAVWGPLGIGAFLLFNHRRQLPLFVGVTLASGAATIFACNWLSAGRMVTSFAALSAAGVSYQDVLLAPAMLLWKLGRCGTGVVILIPALVVELVAAFIQRRTTIFHFAGLACCLHAAIIFTDRGCDFNHLLDLVVLAVVLCGSLWGSLPALRNPAAAVRQVLSVAMVWVLFVGWVNTLVFPAIGAIRAVRTGTVDSHFTVTPLTDLIRDNESVLSEDAWFELARGRLPTVLDTFAFARMSTSHPELTDPLVRRIEAGEFTYLVLLQRMDAGVPTDRYRWEDRAFGPKAIAAMRRNYRFLAEREGYVVYVRADDASTPRKPLP